MTMNNHLDISLSMVTKIIVITLCLISIPMVLILSAFIHNNLPWTDPPGFTTRLQHYLMTNVAETAHESLYPELDIREYRYPTDQLFSLLKASVDKLGWEIDSQCDQAYTLHVVATTPLFGYQDDIYIRLLPVMEERNHLYIRSSSRKGRGDLGTNTRHILDLYNQIEKLVGK